MLDVSRIRRRNSGGGGGADSFANPEAWHYIGETDEPAFENSFTHVGSTQKAGFRKVGDYVEIFGQFLGAANTTIFTLPVGFRPDQPITVFGVAVDLISGGTINTFDGLRISTTGAVNSGANPSGYAMVLWSTPGGIFVPLTFTEDI